MQSNIARDKADDDVVIKVHKVQKFYGLPWSLAPTRLLMLPFKGLDAIKTNPSELAIDGVSFDIRRGELVGIIGRNGAGKSTLLKLISGVSQPSGGRIETRGSIFPMIELNAGMNLSFTGRENIRLLATIMGIDRKHLDEKMPSIEEFCDLGAFFDQPVKNYSSGMAGRLGFAVAIHSDADILLIDEVLAVGDVAFRERCSAKMEELKSSGRTVVLVSHSMSAITKLTNRTIVIERGKVIFEGQSERAVKFYTDFMRNRSLQRLQKSLRNTLEKKEVFGYRLDNVQVLDQHYGPREVVTSRGIFRASLDLAVPNECEQAWAFITILDSNGMALVDEQWEVDFPPHRKLRRVMFEFLEGLPLASGQYILRMGLRAGTASDAQVFVQGDRSFTMINQSSRGAGVIAPAYSFVATSIDQLEEALGRRLEAS